MPSSLMYPFPWFVYRLRAQGPAEEVTDAMARIFVWLRYSASRQLTWQRNYNTQPRILGEAQRRLTDAIAKVRATNTLGTY